MVWAPLVVGGALVGLELGVNRNGWSFSYWCCVVVIVFFLFPG